MSIRVGINGFGRIGRGFLRAVENSDIEVVAVNDLTDTPTMAHLLEFDSTFGRFGHHVAHHDAAIIVDGRAIVATAEREPARLDWGSVGADVVLEATGRFRSREDAAAHLRTGARKVVISAPGKGVDLTVVMGVNHDRYDAARHDIVSNASCTTNCVAPMVKVLDDSFGIVKGFMTTIHGYTNDQVVLDGPHHDLRRGRSAAVNIIPTSTGAARTTGLVIESLAGKLDGVAVRVPVEDGSLTDLALLMSRPASVEDVNDAFATAAAGSLAGVLRYTDRPIVSRDVVGDPASCVFDSSLTQANGELVKVFGWYDNEFGYISRLIDLCRLVGIGL